MSYAAIEYTVNCSVCDAEYFHSRLLGARCEACATCLVCNRNMPKAPTQKYDSMCSAPCQEKHGSLVAALARERAFKRLRSESAQRYEARARAKLFERDNWLCHLCGLSVDRHAIWPASNSPVLDHVIPKSKGGSNSAGNLRTAHALCNNQRKNIDLTDFLKGFRRGAI